jgi:hypothetical protein
MPLEDATGAHHDDDRFKSRPCVAFCAPETDTVDPTAGGFCWASAIGFAEEQLADFTIPSLEGGERQGLNTKGSTVGRYAASDTCTKTPDSVYGIAGIRTTAIRGVRPATSSTRRQR